MSNIVEKTKEEVSKRLVEAMIGLPPILLLIIWQAIPSTTWDLISDNIPKKVIWATTGILVWLILLLFAYIHRLRKEQKQLKEKLTPVLVHAFGASWDKHKTPHCPSCQSALTQRFDGPHALVAGKVISVSERKAILVCLKCDKDILLIDDDGKNINLKKAKELVRFPEKAT